MFKKDSLQSSKSHQITEQKKQSSIPNYKQSKNEVLRAKRCHSNNSTRNPRRVINAIDNLIHKLNDRRKTFLVPTNSYSSDSQSSSTSTLTASDSSTESTKNNSDNRLNEFKTKFKDSPKLILRSTQNYIRSLKRPNDKVQNNKDLFHNNFESSRLKDLEESSILKSLLDSQQYLMIKNRLSQTSIKYKYEETSSSSDNNSNTSCIIHDYSDDSDCVSNQTFVEHSDESCSLDTDLPKGWSVDYKDGKKYYVDQMNLTTHWDQPKSVSSRKNENNLEIKSKNCDGLSEKFIKTESPISPNSILNKVQIPDWLIELSNFREDNIQWESLDLKSLELYELMLQRIHKYELMELVDKNEKYRAKLNEMLDEL